VREAGTSPAEKQSPCCDGERRDCELIQKAIRFLRTATYDRMMNSRRPTLGRHPPVDLEWPRPTG
jgi:hypothetical protein